MQIATPFRTEDIREYLTSTEMVDFRRLGHNYQPLYNKSQNPCTSNKTLIATGYWYIRTCYL